MKDSEFIELLNLYLDHEISAADAARLEAEVLGNPARRRIYQDYCRMSKACKLLAKDFATEVPADGKVVAFEAAQPQRRAGLYLAGGFAAAAACVAFILVSGGRQESSLPTSQPSVVTAPVPSNEPSRIGRVVSMPTLRDEPQAVIVPALALTTGQSSARPSPLFISTDQTPAPQFEWMHTVNLPPVQRASLEHLRFDDRPTLRPENRPYENRAPLRAADEMSAFEFRR